MVSNHEQMTGHINRMSLNSFHSIGFGRFAELFRALPKIGSCENALMLRKELMDQEFLRYLTWTKRNK